MGGVSPKPPAKAEMGDLVSRSNLQSQRARLAVSETVRVTAAENA